MTAGSGAIFMITVSHALSNSMFTIVEREKTPGVFIVKFGKIPTLITIEVSRLEDSRYTLAASHGIKTELLKYAYWVRNRIYATPGEALDDFRRAFEIYYRAAESDGYKPKEKWLVHD
jgi:hypothetical protein